MTIYTYDDAPALRLGEEGMSRADIRKASSQVDTARIDVTITLQAELEEYIETNIRAHDAYIKAEQTLDDL